MNLIDPIWPAEDPHSEMIREVYARFGLAMYMAQTLEHGVVNALFVLRFVATRSEHETQDSWSAAIDAFYSTEFAKTFGNMIRTIQSVPIIPTSLIDQLSNAKAKRDYLAHSFFREHDLAFETQAGRTQMIAECEDATQQFKSCDLALEEFCTPYRQRYGMTDEWLDDGYRQLLEQAQQDFPDEV